jgi:hypothetical protein
MKAMCRIAHGEARSLMDRQGRLVAVLLGIRRVE